MDVLQSHMQDLLFQRRYLLVLDDVWNEDADEWDKLRLLLKCGAEGSIVIVTTRSEKVALVVGTMPSYHLKGLSEDDCWELFQHRAFASDRQEYPNLMPIGKQIVKKCGGVPLAAKTLGSLMRFKREPKEWVSVEENCIWNICGSENGILPALRLSYSHLPPHLKGCFAYLSLFPKNYAIKKDKLIHMWIAAGLIQSSGGSKSLEDTGDEYFKYLTWMSFFQDVKKSSSGDVLECIMHDLIHDLAQSIAGDDFALLEHGRIPRNIIKIRHASLVCDSGSSIIPEFLFEAKNLRTLLLLFPKGDLKEVPIRWFSSFKCLRVLDFGGAGIKKLHSSICNMKFLRYLDLSNTLIEALPETVCNLGNLQVLNLSGCTDLVELPRNLGHMIALRHLILNGCDRLISLPHIRMLRCLQTLPIFIVGKENDQSLIQLARLPLAGELNIRHLENVEHANAAAVSKLGSKTNLHSLGLSWGNDLEGNKMTNGCDERVAQSVLEFLKPHRNLTCLSVKGYVGICFPKWMSALELPNLTKIVLISCRRCEQLPALGNLPFLETIHMQGMDAVTNMGSEFYGEETGRLFPSLKELSLVDFPHLKFWWNGNGREQVPSLVKLKIIGCPNLINMLQFPYLQNLELRNCNEIILRSATNLTSLSSLAIDVFMGHLVPLESLLHDSIHLVSLTISSCPKLLSISSNLGKLISLKSLTVRWCEKLLSLPEQLQNLTSLELLEISECPSLAYLPESIGGLKSLKALSIENCTRITSMPMGLQNLRALEHLTIMYCPNLLSLPYNWQNLSSLKSLYILSCPALVSFPEGLKHVTTLRNLDIHCCPRLEGLPEWIKDLKCLRSLAITNCQNIIALPEGLQYASSLQHLSIQECPVLEAKCKKNGVDWAKIAHVAYKHIGSSEMEQHKDASNSSN